MTSRPHPRKEGEEGGMLSIAAKCTPVLHAPSSTILLLPPKETQVEVWNGRGTILSYTLELGGSRRQAIEAGILRAGGVSVRIEDGNEEPGSEEAEERGKREKERDRREARCLNEGKGVDVYVTRWRGDRGILRLMHAFHLERQLERWRGCSMFKEITLVNYTGQAREYLKKLITATGATFTPR
ncbi:hypothetical protein BDQ17DRAFT_1335176 [Cyathus striatus]|nr:hypothetical protein BDQ17DRAFT_1335176 [Cyathus striatus]